MATGQKTFSERSLHGRVAHEIGRRIVGGTYQPSSILPNEALICAEFEVSRTALREAFKVLSAKGLILSKPKVGTRVNPRKEWNMLDPDVLTWAFETSPAEELLEGLFEMRKVFEPAAAEMAARKHNTILIGALEQAYYDMEASEAGSKERLSSDLRFHQSILEATENEFMVSLGTMVETAVHSAFSEIKKHSPVLPSNLPNHKRVLMAVKTANPTGAFKAMQTLLLQSETETAAIAV